MNTDELCRLTGTTKRQVLYWVKIGLLGDRRPATGPGSRHQWTETDRRVVATIKSVIGEDTPRGIMTGVAALVAVHAGVHDYGYLTICGQQVDWVPHAQQVVDRLDQRSVTTIVPIL